MRDAGPQAASPSINGKEVHSDVYNTISFVSALQLYDQVGGSAAHRACIRDKDGTPPPPSPLRSRQAARVALPLSVLRLRCTQVLPDQLEGIRRVALHQLLSVHRSVLLRESMLQLSKHNRALVAATHANGAHTAEREEALGWRQTVEALRLLDQELQARVAAIEAGLATPEPAQNGGSARVDACGGYAVACRLRGHVFDAHAALERFVVGARQLPSPARGADAPGAPAAESTSMYDQACLKAGAKVLGLLADLLDVIDQQRERAQPLCAASVRRAKDAHRHDRLAKCLRARAVS